MFSTFQDVAGVCHVREDNGRVGTMHNTVITVAIVVYGICIALYVVGVVYMVMYLTTGLW